MLFRFCVCVLVASVCGLLGGCSSKPAGKAPVARPAGPTARDGRRPVAPALRDKGVSENNAAEAHAHFATAIVLEMQGDREAALEEYYQAALKDASNEALVLEVSRQFIESRKWEKALELLTRTTARPDCSAALFGQLGIVYAKLGKTDLAIQASRTAIQKQPRFIGAYRNLFVTCMQDRKTAEALAVLDEAAKVRDTGAPFLIELAELYVNLGLQVPAQKDVTLAKALTVLQRAEKLNPADPDLRLRLANGFNLLGQDQKAAGLYSDLLKHLPDLPLARDTIRGRLAEIYLRMHDSKQAGEQLEAIVRDNPTDARTYYLLGTMASSDKRYADAADFFHKTLLLDPDFEPAYYELTAAQIDADRSSEALATLDQARKKFPQSFSVDYLEGVARTRLKDFAGAVRHFTAAEVIAQATDPKRLNDLFYFQSGTACERSGDYAQAEKYFQKCLQLTPDFAEALNYLGYMWADRGEKLAQARECIEKALKADPKNAAYLDSMGWVLFKLNEPQQALDYILKAAEASPEADAEIYHHLGDIYAALGQSGKAREAWQKSVLLEPNADVQKKLDAKGDK